MNWNPTTYFQHLTATNRLAQQYQFRFCRVNGLEGLEEALQAMQSTKNFVCVSDLSDSYIELENSPHTRRIKTVFLCMRHKIDDMQQREQCMRTMQELFRQFMSHLLRQRTQLEQQLISLDPRIQYNEIDKYFFSGCACTYFQIATDHYTDLQYNADEWE